MGNRNRGGQKAVNATMGSGPVAVNATIIGRDKKVAETAPASSRYASLLDRTFEIYQSGAKELPVALKAEWDAALGTDADTLIGFIIQPIAALDFQPLMAELILGADSKYTALASDWAAVTAYTGHKPGGYNRYESGRSLDALEAKRAAGGSGKGATWSSMATNLDAQRGMGSTLRAWHEKAFPFGERQHTDRGGDTRSKVRDAITDAMGDDKKTQLEAQIAAAEAEEALASKEKRYNDAGVASDKAESLRKELAALKAVPPKTDRKTQLEAQIAAAEAEEALASKEKRYNDAGVASDKAESLRKELAALAATNTTTTPSAGNGLMGRLNSLSLPKETKQVFAARILTGDDTVAADIEMIEKMS